jgi:hypothetical protein
MHCKADYFITQQLQERTSTVLYLQLCTKLHMYSGSGSSSTFITENDFNLQYYEFPMTSTSVKSLMSVTLILSIITVMSVMWRSLCLYTVLCDIYEILTLTVNYEVLDALATTA